METMLEKKTAGKSSTDPVWLGEAREAVGWHREQLWQMR